MPRQRTRATKFESIGRAENSHFSFFGAPAGQALCETEQWTCLTGVHSQAPTAGLGGVGADSPAVRAAE